MARVKNQTARRRQLKEATNRAIANRGIGSVRVKDIADEAGLAPASVLYYYDDLDTLLREALMHAMERFHERRTSAAAEIEDARTMLVETIRHGFPTGPDDKEVVVLYESVPMTREDPALGALLKVLTERQVEMYRVILEAGSAQGHFDLADDVDTIAKTFVALEDAYGLYIVGGGEQLEIDEAHGLLLAYARMATRCELEA